MAAHIAALSELEDWYAEKFAARVHYRGVGSTYSIEYYEPSDCVLHQKVKGDGEAAVPAGRDTVLNPLHRRVRQDLVETGVDPGVEDRVV